MRYYDLIAISILFAITLTFQSSVYGSGPELFGAGISVNNTDAEKVALDTFPITPRYGDFVTDEGYNPFDLKDPSIVEQEVEYDPETGLYIITEKIGDEYYRMPTYMTFEEYLDWRAKKQERDYFRKLTGVQSRDDSGTGVGDPIEDVDVEKDLLDRLFGGTEVTIEPQGNIDLTFGADFQNIENPILTERQRRRGGFDFDMAIQMSVDGSIGDKLNLGVNYNTQATFDFENRMKLEYDADQFGEDEIIRNIEAGNVSLPLNNSLIQGSQSLFGLKTELQFGRLYITTIASQQRSERNEIEIQGGSQLQEFEVPIDQYDQNRHFFLAHYARDQYEEALVNLPQIKSLIEIQEIEVWVTNTRNETTDVRDVIAIADLGEGDPMKVANTNPDLQPPGVPVFPDDRGNPLPENGANPIYQKLINNPDARELQTSVSVLQGPEFGLEQVQDFEKVQARQLNPSEYTINTELGYISLNINLQPADVLGVAYKYKYNDGPTRVVGEFSSEVPKDTTGSPKVLYLKMLKSTTQNVRLPMWDLMMKNVYAIGAFQVNPQEFNLDIYYDDPGKGFKRFLPNSNLFGVPLLTLFNLDNLNRLGDPQPDGVFDYVPGVTINTQNGRVFFPKLEPFGTHLKQELDPPFDTIYPYQELYDSTLFKAQEVPEKNRFYIKGSYKSSITSEISLGAFNIPRNSVQVYAGGRLLKENIDYEIDYNIGRVKILNDAILNLGQPIRVSFEDNTLFGFQTKTMLGTRLDYRIKENFNIGGTYLQLIERPFTQKVNIGDDPINNKIFGLDLNYSDNAPWLTKLVDRIPLIDTKEESNISLQVEAAALKPGHARAINLETEGEEKGGAVFLDDFEGTTSSFDLRTPTTAWVLASVPQYPNSAFPEGQLINDINAGVNRALINWYRLEGNLRDQGDQDSAYTRSINQQEIFPNFQPPPQNAFAFQNLPLDITYYPSRRGPYNFDRESGTAYSDGIGQNGRLVSPRKRWGGIMRALQNTDFEAANIEYLEFWVMSPFINDQNNPGELVIHLGNISEDILRDGRKFFENGLPTDDTNSGTEETNWSRVPITQQITNAFDNDPENREKQDVGLDGLDNEGEKDLYSEWINSFTNIPQEFQEDPAGDDYAYIRDPIYTDQTPLLERYTKFNNPEGNSRANPGSGNVEASTNIPDSEDLNRDNSLSEAESYYEYRIPLIPDQTGGIQRTANDYITDEVEARDNPITGQPEKWYRFKIPRDQFTEAFGGIQDFRSIRFIRMYLTGFQNPVTMRFARLELVRNQWRRYTRESNNTDIDGIGNCFADAPPSKGVAFDVNAVNFEENANREPFPYALPPGINREQALSGFADALQNEQSLALEVCNMTDGAAKAIFKVINFDMRFYERLKMFVHAEEAPEQLTPIDSNELEIFIRLGSDFEENYYEYRMPLIMSDINASAGDEDYAEELWKNEFNFPLELLTQAKTERNANQFDVTQRYTISNPEMPTDQVTVKGNPNLGYVKGIMVGVANPCDDTPDGSENFCFETWINELRLTGLDEEGGVAALARMDMQLADFGSVSLAGNFSSIGFGGLEQKLQDRSREDEISYDIATNLQLGKFFPEESGISIPFYAQVSKTIKTPQYDPYDLDLKLDQKLAEASTAPERDSIKKQAQDVTSIKSFNFTNVRKEPSKDRQATPKPWDISNFSATYAYTETQMRNPIIEDETQQTYHGEIDYRYNTKPKYVEPFKQLIKKDKYLKFLTNFNFNPVPNSFGFNTAMDRNLMKTTYRFTSPLPRFSTFYIKTFTWDRDYRLKWDLTRSLNLTFNALNQAVIDELEEFPEGSPAPTDEEKKDFIWQNIQDFGRTKNYQHNISLNYNVPFQHFPFMDWINVRANYGASYSWNAASLNVDSLGNVIQNTQTRQLSGDLNFETLYNKWDYLKKINRSSRGRSARSPRGRRGPQGRNDDQQDDQGRDGRGGRGSSGPSTLEKVLIRPLLSLRKARLRYAENLGTVVPGYKPQTNILGLNSGFNAPGWDFVAGLQPDEDWFTRALDSDNNFQDPWLTGNKFQTQDIYQDYSQTIDGSINLEPINDFRIDLDLSKEFTENHRERVKDPDPNDNIQELMRVNPQDFGSYSISYNTINTLFETDIERVFQDFEANRKAISQRLGALYGISTPHPEDPGYVLGYGRYQQDVLIPSFIAAYTGQNVNDVRLDVFKTRPRINWAVSYNGLDKLPWLKDHVKNATIKHGYQSSLTINSFQTDILANLDSLRSPSNLNPLTSNYYAEFEIPNIVTSERLNPLIGIDVRLNNDMNVRFEYKKNRNLSFTFSDYQLAETKSTEIVFSFGYRLKGVNLFGGGNNRRRRAPGGDDDPDVGAQDDNIGDLLGLSGGDGGHNLDIRIDFSFRDDITINHLLDQGQQIPTRGAKTIRISPSADYVLNQRLTLRFFFDRTQTIPATSASFPITNTQTGITVRFALN